jgi:hypothetical protein
VDSTDIKANLKQIKSQIGLIIAISPARSRGPIE